MTQLFAVVKWISGEDKGTYSVDVPTDWILDFSYDDYKKDSYDPDFSFVIEWRRGKKPAAGWKVYDGLVAEVSSSVAVLERKFTSKYNGAVSPKVIADPEDQNIRGNTNTPTHSADSNAQHPRQLFSSSSDNDDVNLQILNQLKGMREELAKQNRKRRRCSSDQSDSDDDNNPGQYEVGRTGSGIKITERQWSCAKAQNSCTAMATALLTAIVPLKTLLKSNCKGGKPKITKDPQNVIQHDAIRQDVLDGIKYTCENHFKKTYNATRIHSAINAKLNALRSKAAKQPNNNADQ